MQRQIYAFIGWVVEGFLVYTFDFRQPHRTEAVGVKSQDGLKLGYHITITVYIHCYFLVFRFQTTMPSTPWQARNAFDLYDWFVDMITSVSSINEVVRVKMSTPLKMFWLQNQFSLRVIQWSNWWPLFAAHGLMASIIYYYQPVMPYSSQIMTTIVIPFAISGMARKTVLVCIPSQ